MHGFKHKKGVVCVPPGSTGDFILAFLLILMSAFFSMSETALTALNKYKIKSLSEVGQKRAKQVERVVENKDKLLSSILIGNNLSNIALGSIATTLAMSISGNATSILIATGTATLFLLIFGEITPKRIALEYPEKISMLVAKPLSLLMLVLSPIASMLNFVISMALKPLGFSVGEKESGITEDELKIMLEVGFEEGVIESDERKMIDNVMEFDDVYAKDIMTPRTDMIVIDVGFTYYETLGVFTEARMSRLPVCDDSIDNIVGVLHIKDFVCAASEGFSVSEHMREVFFTLEQKRTRELFKEMRKGSSSLAIVLDEYGGTAGLLSIEDIIEEIVGEIFDEHDDARNHEIELVSDGEYIVSGIVKIDDFNEVVEQEMLASEEYESIGGYVMGLVGGVPEAGLEVVDTVGKTTITFTVLEVQRNRIERLNVRFVEASEENEEANP
ncbi:MAG: hemolysin family protein [Turicibacter sp.]|nr:hemolysin family protein [Turicibacter sp.]